MKRYRWIIMPSLLLLSTTNFAQGSMSIEQAADSVAALNLTINTEAKKLSLTQPETPAKHSLSNVMQTENLKSILLSGSGQSHKYVQQNFMLDKNQQSMITAEHLINSVLNNNKLDIPFKSSGDELLTMHWQLKHHHQGVSDIYSTWLLDANKAAQFTEKTAALISVRPLISAALLTQGNDFPVRLYHQFSALDGHTLEAIHISSKQQITAVSDANGIAVVNLSQAGDWILMLKHEDQQKGIMSTSYALLNFHVKRGEQ